MYDNIIPLILKNSFHLGETVTGVIMAADNVLALFLLPFFGSLSDKTNTRIGKRMPFIIGGTLLADIFLLILPAAIAAETCRFLSSFCFWYCLPWDYIVLPLLR